MLKSNLRLISDIVSTFMDNNPEALSSDILEFISGQNDFCDEVYADTEVS